MRLGIDFGTTHTVVALVDRGNYPVVSFDGDEFYPSVVAGNPSGDLAFGPRALEMRLEPGWELRRSFKRLLSDAGPGTTVSIAGREHLLSDLLAGYLSSLHAALLAGSNAGLDEGEPLEVAVSVPANATSAQRFLTLDAYARAGFAVVALLNEPSAAGFEYAHRYRTTITARREYVAIYDLGGGTFDASLLRMSGRSSQVVGSEGIQRLGGDDFDEAILGAVLGRLGNPDLPASRRSLLLEECARQKEAVNPNTRRLLVDLTPLQESPVAVPIDEVYEACAPLVTRSVATLVDVLVDPRRGEPIDEELAGIYVVGGSGAFPLVARLLRERWGERRVKRSPHPFAATAIGLAIFLDQEAGYTLSDRLSRTFGVFREASSGTDVVFDPIFGAETPLPAPGEPPVTTVRVYRTFHDIGHYRFVECSRVVGERPDGDVTPWDEFRFPFDAELRDDPRLAELPVTRDDVPGPWVEERYTCADAGTIEVTVTDLTDGFSRTFRLGRALRETG